MLIFLIISATFTRYQELAITLPTASGNESQAENKQIHIAVSRDGRFAINGKLTDPAPANLSKALTQFSNESSKQPISNLQVNIDADVKAPHQSVMTALEAARDANLSNIVLVVKPKNKRNQ